MSDVERRHTTYEPTSRFPASLALPIIEGGLPWESAVTVTMPNFLDQYTLHDSIWEGLWLEPANSSALAVIRWDTIWTEGKVPHPGSEVATWPILLIGFTPVHQVLWRDPPHSTLVPEQIDGATSVPISLEEREQFLASLPKSPGKGNDWQTHVLNRKLYCTQVHGSFYGSIVEIVHGGPISLLCFSSIGDLLPVPLPQELIVPDDEV